jgi:hypothetical protein
LAFHFSALFEIQLGSEYWTSPVFKWSICQELATSNSYSTTTTTSQSPPFPHTHKKSKSIATTNLATTIRHDKSQTKSEHQPQAISSMIKISKQPYCFLSKGDMSLRRNSLVMTILFCILCIFSYSYLCSPMLQIAA